MAFYVTTKIRPNSDPRQQYQNLGVQSISTIEQKPVTNPIFAYPMPIQQAYPVSMHQFFNPIPSVFPTYTAPTQNVVTSPQVIVNNVNKVEKYELLSCYPKKDIDITNAMIIEKPKLQELTYKLTTNRPHNKYKTILCYHRDESDHDSISCRFAHTKTRAHGCDNYFTCHEGDCPFSHLWDDLIYFMTEN